MASRLWGIPLVVAGFVALGIVVEIGWTCPTGDTGYCSHAYFATGWAAVFMAGVVLVLVGTVLIAVLPTRSSR